MKTNNSIQKNYFDALFYANSTLTEKLDFHISPAEFKLLLKLIHYSTKQTNITWVSTEISKHTSMTVGVIDKSIQRLRQKGYINTSTYQVENNIKHRTIFINWDKIQIVDDLYNESLSKESDIEVEDILNITLPEENETITFNSNEIKIINVNYEDDFKENILELKEKLESEYPLKSDIEMCLIKLFTKKFTTLEIEQLSNYVYKNRKTINIQEFVDEKLKLYVA